MLAYQCQIQGFGCAKYLFKATIQHLDYQVISSAIIGKRKICELFLFWLDRLSEAKG